jgi:hypothetical protein
MDVGRNETPPQDLRNKALYIAGIIDLVSNQPHESGLITAEKSFLSGKAYEKIQFVSLRG